MSAQTQGDRFETEIAQLFESQLLTLSAFEWGRSLGAATWATNRGPILKSRHSKISFLFSPSSTAGLHQLALWVPRKLCPKILC
jgi:hypothetical protein